MTESEFLSRLISTDTKDAVEEADGGSATEKAAKDNRVEEGGGTEEREDADAGEGTTMSMPAAPRLARW